MRGRLLAAALVGMVALAVTLAGVAWAASTSTTLNGGDSLTVNCASGAGLTQAILSKNQIRTYCQPNPTATTKPGSSTTTTTRPPEPTTIPPSQNAQCTTAKTGGIRFAYAPQITNSNGYNTYVSNDMWGALAGTTQNLCATDPGHWTLDANVQPKGYTGVQTYPDVQQLFNNFNPSANDWSGGPAPTDTPIAKLKSLTSQYAVSNPPTTSGVWQSAYDIWTSSGEFMIWTTYSDVRLHNNGAKILNQDVVVGGAHYTDMQYGGSLNQMVLQGNQASATVDLLSVLNYWIQQGRLSASATIGQLNYGWELCSTDGPTRFAMTNYTLQMAA